MAKPPADAEPLALADALTDTLIDTDASTWALRAIAMHAPTLIAASPPPLTTACTPSTLAFTEATAPSARAFMPTATLRRSGRFFSRAVASFAPALTSAPPENETLTEAGVQLALAETFASQFDLHSAETLGISTLPEHLGSFIFTEQPPEQVPEHLACAVILQLAEHLPEHLPEQEPLPPDSHLPSHLPLQTAPFESLPSHLPSHLPPHSPEKPASQEPEQSPPHSPEHSPPASAVQEPLHSASHLPEISPPSHLTSAPPPLTEASHEAAQSAVASSDALQTGGLTSTLIEPAALASAFAVPRNLTATLHACSAFLPGPSSAGLRSASLAPRSFARFEHAMTTSPSISAARPWSSAAAAMPPLTLPSRSPFRPKLALRIADGSFMSGHFAGMGTPGTPGRPPQSMRRGEVSIAKRTGHVTTRQRFETIFRPSVLKPSPTTDRAGRTVHNPTSSLEP